jgi:fluoroacetyl-CoA thioesterase
MTDMTDMTGATAELTHVVAECDGANAWGNDLPVLATPVLLWLGELVCMRAVRDQLQDDEMTVGAAHDAGHLAPTPVGASVHVSARLTAVDGQRLRFEVAAEDDSELVYRGTHDRVVVSRSRFERRVAQKSALVGGVPAAAPQP